MYYLYINIYVYAVCLFSYFSLKNMIFIHKMCAVGPFSGNSWKPDWMLFINTFFTSRPMEQARKTTNSHNELWVRCETTVELQLPSTVCEA